MLEMLKKHTIFRLKGWKRWNFIFIFKTKKFYFIKIDIPLKIIYFKGIKFCGSCDPQIQIFCGDLISQMV